MTDMYEGFDQGPFEAGLVAGSRNAAEDELSALVDDAVAKSIVSEEQLSRFISHALGRRADLWCGLSTREVLEVQRMMRSLPLWRVSQIVGSPV